MRPPSQIPVSFPYQSYFDSALEEKAILYQPTNDLIIASTKKESHQRGRVVAVAGHSDSPVAFQFSDSAVMICRPGEAIYPGKFDGFKYGLPFGWLGGGRATILVAEDENARLDLGSSRAEMVFHRTRLQIEASGVNLPALKRNWPLSFPWTWAVRGAGSADQRGAPLFKVHPTRTLLRLRMQLAVNKIVSFVFRGSREFDEASDGTYTLGNLTAAFTEVQFAASTDPSLKPYPTAALPQDFLHLACDEGGITALGLGDAALTGIEIDVVRFGRI